MKSEPLNAIIALLPPDLQKQITDNITFDQSISISLAPAVVSAGAGASFAENPPTDAGPLPPTTDVSGDDLSGDLGAVPSSPVGTGDTVDPVPAGNGGGGTSVVLQTDFNGVPLWLVIVLVLLAFISSRPLVMLADRLLAARVGGVACPEGR